MYEIVRYTPELKAQWDSFVRKSRNGTFLFLRDYMDYHRQRFTDFSLLIFHKQSLVALLPLNKERDGSVTSHSGLTYGGLITDKKGRAEVVTGRLRSMGENLRRLEAVTPEEVREMAAWLVEQKRARILVGPVG